MFVSGCTGIAIPLDGEVIHMEIQILLVVFTALSFLVALINLIIVLIKNIK